MNRKHYGKSQHCNRPGPYGSGFFSDRGGEIVPEGRGRGRRHHMRFHGGSNADDRGFGRGRHGASGRHHGSRGEGQGQGGRGRRQRRLGADELRLLLLHLIAGEARHGYDLIRAVGELTDGAYTPSPGMVYPTLNLIEEMGHISSSSDGSRKIYATTSEGEAELAEKAPQIAAIIDRLTSLGARHAEAGRSPVRRAMENLKAVLMNRPQDEIGTDHEIAAIIDEVAQRIERL